MSLAISLSVPERRLEVDLEVADAETVALLGPNGAGKSTVLAVVAGLLRPRPGRVSLDGRALTDVDDHGRARRWVAPHERQVALLAQDPLLFPHLTALDNVAFGPRAAGRSRRESRAHARRWLADVGVPELGDRRPVGLSGGQAQRVAVARALAAHPRVLLLDEPMAALDVAVAPALRQTLRRVLADQTTLLVTHDPLDALLLADRVVVVDEGRVVEEGRAREVLARPRSAFTAQVAGLNLVAGTWRGGAVHPQDGPPVQGTHGDVPPAAGAPAVAVFHPRTVAVYAQPPGGSPRNTLAVTVTLVEPHGDRTRVRAGELTADITTAAAAELDLAPGDHVHFAIKATEVAVYAG